ncbi:MAG: hypothetical protein M3443_13200 [Actinomycetota bacterium]|nr:hypothetical protein [Actinomycetota bacterium]
MTVDPGDSGLAGGSLFDGMTGFAVAAASGQVEVSQEGGEALLAVIGRFLDEMLDQEDALSLISMPPPLGGLKGGEVMAPFMVQVATDGEGFLTRFRELRKSLVKAEEAIRQSMANYRETEEANRASIDKVDGGSR